MTMCICSIAVLPKERLNMWAKIRKTGVLYSVGIVINRINPVWLFRFRHFLVYQMDVDSFTDQRKSESPIDVSWCAQADQIQAVENLTYVEARNLNPKHTAAQAKSGEHLAGALWAVKHELAEVDLGIRFELDPDQVWLFAALVDAKFRRQGVYRRVLSFVCRRCDADFADNENGPAQLLLCVNPHNIASNRVHQKHAQETLGRVVCFRFFNVGVCLCQGKRLVAGAMITWDAKNQPISIRFRSL